MDLFDNGDINLEQISDFYFGQLENSDLSTFTNIRILMHHKFNQGVFAQDRSILCSALKEYDVFMQRGISLSSDETKTLTALASMVQLAKILQKIQSDELVIKKINFQEMKKYFLDGWCYSYASEPFLILSFSFFYHFLREHYLDSALVMYTLSECKLQQAFKTHENKLSEMLPLMTRGDFLKMKMTSLYDGAMMYLQSLWKNNKPDPVDENAKLNEILDQLKIPVTLPSCIKNKEDAEKCFKFVLNKSREAIEYVKSNKEALDRADEASRNKKSTDDVTLMAKFIVAYANARFAEYKDPKEKAKMHDTCIKMLQKVKGTITEITGDNAGLYAKTMLQLALSLLALMEPYKEKQNAQLEQYCLKYIAHYAEFEEFVRKLDSSMRLNGDLMSDCEETYNLTINFFKDVKKDERKSKSVAEKCMRFQESCGDSENLFLQEIIAQALGGQ